jgi:proline iminopeptidase
MQMLSLYPEITAFNEAQLKVSDQHTLWYAEYGNPLGLPAVFLHGGPGSGCEDYHPRFFDPKRYRIILFDQRGAGRSTPHACLDDNTTHDLIEDLEKLRQHLDIQRWVVFGGSWGSTLGLAYTQAHAQNVLGLILRGVFLCRDEDIKWFYQQGASAIFPDYWQAYEAIIPKAERKDMVAAYYRRLTGDDQDIQLKAAQEWSIWEGNTSTLIPKDAVRAHFGDPRVALSLARIECHYFMNNSYLRTNQLIEDASKLASVPGYIVHGRYDVVCPIDQAYALHQAWPQANFTIAPNSGHSATEVEIVDALIKATNALADQFA